MLDVPPQLRKNVKDEWGKKGEAWLQNLPQIIEKCEQLWHLEIEKSSFELSYNYVTSVKQEDGSSAILKVGFPHEELFNEVKTLQVLDGHCVARLLNSNKELAAMLIEKIQPGTVLKSIHRKNDEEATKIAAELIRTFPIAVPANSTFPTVAQWTEVFRTIRKKKNSPLPLSVLEKAESLFKDLNQSKSGDALLHGDLHHDNILFDEKRGWLSIDPKGVIGEPMFNAARFLNNPNPGLIEMENPKKIMEQRLEIFSSAFNANTKRIAAWAYVDCILTACWWIESGGKTCNFSLRCAEILDSLL